MGDFDLILDAAAIGGADALATGQEERPGTRGSPEQERREPDEGVTGVSDGYSTAPSRIR